jgi:hypothetical protein
MEFRWNEWNIEHIGKRGVRPEEAESLIRVARSPFPRKPKMTKSKPIRKMKPNERETATEQFDEPFVIDRSRPLTRSEQDQWERVLRKRGRPKVGKGFKRV